MFPLRSDVKCEPNRVSEFFTDQSQPVLRENVTSRSWYFCWQPRDEENCFAFCRFVKVDLLSGLL